MIAMFRVVVLIGSMILLIYSAGSAVATAKKQRSRAGWCLIALYTMAVVMYAVMTRTVG